MAEQRFESVEARGGRIVVGRLLPGSDLIGGLEAVCDGHDIRFAAINFAYGSLSRASFMFLQIPPGEERAVLVPHEVEGRVEFLGGQGLICEDERGARATHLHGSISDDRGQVLGGHFRSGENPIYNNLDYELVELLGVQLRRIFDPETNTVEMIVQEAAGNG